MQGGILIWYLTIFSAVKSYFLIRYSTWSEKQSAIYACSAGLPKSLFKKVVRFDFLTESFKYQPMEPNRQNIIVSTVLISDWN